MNYPFLLTLGMLTCLFSTGVTSYKLGDAALEGVTQPTTGITQKSTTTPKEITNQQRTASFTPVNIDQVTRETQIYIQNQQKRTEKTNKVNPDSITPKVDPSPNS